MDEETQNYNRAAGPLQQGSLIITSATGLTTGDVDIPTQDGKIPGYFAHLKDAIHVPIILVVSEAFGLHEHIP